MVLPCDGQMVMVMVNGAERFGSWPSGKRMEKKARCRKKTEGKSHRIQLHHHKREVKPLATPTGMGLRTVA